MAYLGHSPTQAGSFIEVDDFGSSFNGSTVAFTLQVGSTDITPNAQNLLVVLDGVVQMSGSAYSVSGSTITFTEAPASGTDLYCLLMGQSASVGQGTIGAAELKVSGNGSSGQVLTSDGDGTFSWATDTEPYLPLAGGTMTGAINLGSQNITNGGTITGTFVGNITGNVTGNTSGTAATVTGAAQSNITSVGTLTSLTTSGTITSSTGSTTDSVLTLTDAGVADYKFTFPDTSTIRLSTNTTSTKVFDLSNAGSGKMKLSVDGGLRPITGSDYSLVLESTNELNFYNADGYADSNRATLHINYSGTGSSVDLANSELVVTKGTGSTFAGTARVEGKRLDLASGTSGNDDFYIYSIADDTDGDQRIGSAIKFVSTAASNANDGQIAFMTASSNTNTEKLRITSEGRVIQKNTSLANSCFDIVNGSSSGYGLYIKAGNSGNYALSVNDYGANNLMVVNGNGNAGIGNASPGAKLEIRDDDTSAAANAYHEILRINNQTGNASDRTAMIGFSSYNNGNNTAYCGARTEGTGAQTGFEIGVHSGATLEERFRIGSNSHTTVSITSTPTGSNQPTQTIQFRGYHANTGDGKRTFSKIVSTKHNNTGGSVQGDLVFYTNNSSNVLKNRLRLMNDGEVRIGEGEDGYLRHYQINSSAHNYVIYTYSDDSYRWNRNGSGSDEMRLESDGDVHILGSLSQNSDIRLKKNIKTIDNALSKVNQLRGVTYNWKVASGKDTEAKQLGMIADEVEEIVPELVKIDSVKGSFDEDGLDNIKSLKYGNVVGLLVEAVKELSAKVEALENA